jgi:acetyl esterase
MRLPRYAPESRRSEPAASPLLTPDLSGLPPAVVVVAEYDPLRDEVEAYATRLAEAGVDVEAKLFEGQSHGFVSMINILPGSQSGIDYIVNQITTGLVRSRITRKAQQNDRY